MNQHDFTFELNTCKGTMLAGLVAILINRILSPNFLDNPGFFIVGWTAFPIGGLFWILWKLESITNKEKKK